MFPVPAVAWGFFYLSAPEYSLWHTIEEYLVLEHTPCFLVLVLITRECRLMIGYSAIASAIAYIAIPLVFLFLQNVIPLATGALALAIISVMIFIVFKDVLSGGSEGGSASSGASSSGSGSSWSSNYNKKKVNTGNLSECGEKREGLL